jgi:prepilin-type N-terminal cleavage/methylation domain-containing protein
MIKTDNLEKNRNKKACPEKLQRSGGFTLIEVIVAIFILVLAVTGPMSAAQNSLKASFLARDQVVAFYLAQDAIEYIKNYKDTSIISNAANSNKTIIHSSILAACSTGNTPCEVDTLNDNGALPSDIKKCNSNPCGLLYFNSTNKTYSPDSNKGDLSKFSREIYIKEIKKDVEYSVTVVIKWQPNFSTPRKIVVQENIYNWLPGQ